MNRCLTTVVIVFATLFASEALALKTFVYVPPNTTTFSYEPQHEDRMVRFTIVHDPKDVPNPSNEPLGPTRTAQLKISDGTRLILTAPIAPRVNKDGKLVYEFRISEEHAPCSSLIIPENPSGYLGDGTIYQYSFGAPEILRKVFESHDEADAAASIR